LSAFDIAFQLRNTLKHHLKNETLAKCGAIMLLRLGGKLKQEVVFSLKIL